MLTTMKRLLAVGAASALMLSSFLAAPPAVQVAFASTPALTTSQVSETGAGPDEVVCFACALTGSAILYAGAAVWPLLLGMPDRVAHVAAQCLQACRHTIEKIY